MGEVSIKERLIMLFGYETQGGRKSRVWGNAQTFPYYTVRNGSAKGIVIPLTDDEHAAAKQLENAYELWENGKRKFIHDEVIRGEWLKQSDIGLSFIVIFHPEGKLTERSESD
jgi:hypothetical protein